MKRLITMLILILLVFGWAMVGQAATQEIPVVQVLGSPNSSITGPVAYLDDGDTETAWITTGTNPTSAWAVLQLANPVLLDGLKFYGPCAGELTVEYWQNNSWHHFIAADRLPGESFNPDWNLLDLSYDRITTDRIRLWIDNSQQFNQIGGIGEVKILGRNSQDLLERLDPVKVSSNRKPENTHPVNYLFDHNTYSSWWLSGGTPANGEAVADLGEVCAIQRIKVFGSGDGNGQFKLQYLSGGNWLDIPGLTNLNIKQIGAAWQSFAIPAGIKTNQIKAVLNSTQRVGGLREIEIWGQKAFPTGSSYLDGDQAPVQLSAVTSANYTYNISNPVSDPVILHVVTAGTSATPLSWELNGQPMGNLTPAGAIRGFIVYRQTIAANLLWSGYNFIRLNGDNLTVRDCKLEVNGAAGLDCSGNSLVDRWLLTPVVNSSQIIDLNGSYQLDELVLTYLGNQPQVTIAVNQNGSWVTLTGLPRNITGAVGGELTYTGIGLIRKLKVDFNPGTDTPAEITLHGSRINDGPPQIEILSPINGTFFNYTTWGQANITGTVDNPDVTVRVNGQGMTLDGTSFKVPLPVAGNPDSNKTIQVVATDAQGRTGSDQVTVYISNPPEFTVNLPDQLIYTTQSQITVSGQVVVPKSKIIINGLEVPLANLNFSKAVPLKEGLNLITIKVMPPGNPQWATLQRRVVRTGGPPSLKVLYPVNGQIVKDSQIMVSGQVGSLTPVTVTVNGKAATVSSGSFTSNLVALVEGTNTITVIATDKNGQSVQQVVKLNRDQTKPVLSDITPADQKSFNTATVTVSGKVSDASPVSVLVNGVAANLAKGQFTITLPVIEGWNDLKTIATDSAGNTATDSRRVLIDTVPPQDFSVSVNISGWSNNNKPAITFSTSDASSGIDHYEVAVDNGLFSGPVVSPYTFTTVIPDGEHVIKVKAYDKAGNATVSSGVKVYIDTVQPVVPANFEVISGIGRVILKWQGVEPENEVVGYRIIRSPAFSSGSFKDISRSTELIPVIQYFDQDVAPGVSYTYNIKALDHAGNYSQATQSYTVTVGTAAKTIDSQGGTVKFDNCQLTLAQGTIANPGQVVLKQTIEDLPENSYGIKTGPAYSLSLQNQSGQELETKFEEPARLTISYANLQLPAGYTKGDLGVYWYNKVGGYWEKLDYAQFDYFNQTISVNLYHFSDYQVMASKYHSPSLDSYYNMGVSPFQSYFQNNLESVSPAGGSLAISATDLKLPGRGGFDLVIKRIYDSGAAIQEGIMASNPDQSERVKTPLDTFGSGWSLSIPWIERTDKGKFVRLPEGQTVKIELDANGIFEYHQGLHFRLVANGFIGGYSLTMNDGSRYEFAQNGKVTSITDPTGMNTIYYAYSGRQLTTITDSIGRVVTFHYTTAGGKSVIDSITTGMDPQNVRTIRFGYNANGDLTDVYEPVISKTNYTRHTQYAYESHTFQSGIRNEMSGLSGDDDNKIFNYSVDLLNTITYPTQAKSEYTYEFRNQDYYQEIESKFFGVTVSTAHITFKGTKVLVGRNLVAGKETNYTYNMNDRIGSFDGGGFKPAHTLLFSAQTKAGERTDLITFQQIEGNQLVNVPGNMDNYKGPLAVSSTTTIENTDNPEVEKVTYSYDIPLRVVTGETHFRGGKEAYQVTSQYDGWGNLTSKVTSWKSIDPEVAESSSLTETWSYHPHNRIKMLPETYTKINPNPVTQTSTSITTSFQYDDNLGKPLTVTVSDGNKNMVTRFTYDNKGNMKTKLEEFRDNLKTEIFYDTTYQAFPVEQKVYGIKDAAGNVTDIDTKVDYNYETGLKLWEQDARGFKTYYEYDELNRVTKVTYPDDDQDNTNNPYRRYIFHDDVNTCEYYNEKQQRTLFKFDGIGRLTDIIKDSAQFPNGVKTSYHYNNLGQTDQITDALGHVTSYQYDGLNRVKKVTYPGRAYVDLNYDDASNTVMVVDENGGTVSEQSDWANRLVKANQYLNDGSIYTWRFTYDSLGNKVRQLDPKSNQTDQTYDAFGRLTTVQMPTVPTLLPGAANPTDYRPTLVYEYNLAGFKTADISANENAKNTSNKNKTEYEYDQLGRVIRTTTRAKDIFSGQMVSSITNVYYDAAGNKEIVIDPNGGITRYTYSARGYLLTQTDPLGHVTRYQYDQLGNKTAVTDPRGNGMDGSFTAYYQYDDLNHLVKTIFPDQTFTEISYDALGNKLAEKDPKGLTTSYTYTPRNWVETVSVNGQVKTSYVYDAKGNQVEIHDALGNITKKEYDSLGRVIKVTQLGKYQVSEAYRYDEVGNKVEVTVDQTNRTEYQYNGLGWQTGFSNPLTNLTQYFYDPNGNRVKTITANGLTLRSSYDELNRVVESFDSLEKSTKYSYDPVGNRKQIVDRRGTTWIYQYYPNNLVQRLDLTGQDGSSYYVSYTYDAAGNRMTVDDPGNVVKYNFQNGVYQTDPMNRLNSVERSFDGATYRTAYQYDPAGLLTRIKYPEAADWLQYNYNQLNQLSEVVGFTKPRGVSYDDNGALTSLAFANGVTSGYSYDNNHRVEDYQVTLNGANLLKQHFTYDGRNNIKAIEELQGTKTFDYDANNQLLRSITPGKFLEAEPTAGNYGLELADYQGAFFLNVMPDLTGTLGLDYYSSSIGIDFGSVQPGVKKILLIPDQDHSTHRINEKTFALYQSNDNLSYALIPRANWDYIKDSKGVITLTLKERLSARYLKLHVKYDDRGIDFKPKNKSTFLNDIAKIIRVYQESPTRTEDFEYDRDGNRKLQRVTLVHTKSFTSLYYTDSDRLKTDGKNAFKYDDAGNLVEKGNKFNINGDNVTFSVSGDGVEYWRYSYDLLNRLIQVTKNGTIVSEYAYDPGGLRVVKRARGETTHYVFEGTEPIFEKRIEKNTVKSYVYAFGKHLARVDGVVGDTSAKVYYYHTDYLGSVGVITDQSGKIVFNADYFAFGTKYISNEDFDEVQGFTGKEYDVDIGLYYFNARWYDPELGRFISEDPAADPNNPNLYSYCGNNPTGQIDPTGEFAFIPFLIQSFIGGVLSGLESQWTGGDFTSGFFIGAISSGLGYGFGDMLKGTSLAKTLGPLGTRAFANSLTSGTMSVLMGGDFWSGARTGAISGLVSGWLDENFLKVDDTKPENRFLAPLRNWFVNALGAVGNALINHQEISTKTILGPTLSSIFNSTLVYDSKDKDYTKELKALGIEVNGDVVCVEKTQTMEDGVVTTKFEIFVKKDLGSVSYEPDDNIKLQKIDSTTTGQSVSVETNSTVIMMSVSIKSTGAVTIDAHCEFENKYLTTSYGWLNGQPADHYSNHISPGITTQDVTRISRRYQWDASDIKGNANLSVGIIYRPISEPLGNWAGSDEVYVKMNLSQYIK